MQGGPRAAPHSGLCLASSSSLPWSSLHLSALASLEVLDGGKTLKTNGRTTMGGTTTYQYPQPASSSVTLKISVSQGTSRQTVRF